MNITTKSNQLVLTLMVLFFSLMLACKSKEEVVTPPNQPPGNFNVTSTLSTNGQDVILKWTKSKDPEGDAVTYSVVYTDTLAKNLSDTTYTIKNLPFETEIKGSVVARDTKGSKTVSNFSIKTGADYVSIPDVNFEKGLITLGFDNVQDGKILKTNALKVTSLKLDNEFKDTNDKIKNLKGIEEFINLKELNCGYNLLSNLDLSKNINLVTLSCYGNLLTSLDISKNINIVNLNCAINQLASLDVSKNTFLKKLFCQYNLLTQLDINQNLTLDELSVTANKLKVLDVGKNVALTRLKCSYNQILNLDVRKNVLLSEFDCSDNQLTTLDVSKNTNLAQLNCTYNKIQTICISNNNQIQNFWYKDNSATYKVCL